MIDDFLLLRWSSLIVNLSVLFRWLDSARSSVRISGGGEGGPLGRCEHPGGRGQLIQAPS